MGLFQARREPDSASLRKFEVASFPEMVKPTRDVKQRAFAASRPRGVVGDSGHRKNSQEPERPDSERLILLSTRGNARRAKEPHEGCVLFNNVFI